MAFNYKMYPNLKSEFRTSVEARFPGSIGLLSSITGANYNSITSGTDSNNESVGKSPIKTDSTSSKVSKRWMLYNPEVYYKQDLKKPTKSDPSSTFDVLTEIDALREKVNEMSKTGNNPVAKVPVIDDRGSHTIGSTATKENETWKSGNSAIDEDTTKESHGIFPLTALLGKPGAKPATSVQFPLYDPKVYYRPSNIVPILTTPTVYNTTDGIMKELQELRQYVEEISS